MINKIQVNHNSSLYFKYIIVGNSATRKTTFFHSLSDKKINQEKSTISVDYMVRKLTKKKKKVTVHI